MKKNYIAELNDKFNVNNRYPNIFYDALGLFYRLSLFMNNLYTDDKQPFDEYNNLHYVGIMDNIELIKEYYKINNINLDIDELINNGTINFIEQEDRRYVTKGLSHSINGNSLIEVWTQGNIFDSIVLIHELSHYKNRNSKSQVRDLLTEGIAYTEEQLFVDFLEENYYKGIKEIWNKIMNFYAHMCCKKAYKNLKIHYLFDEMGNIDKDTYELYFDDNSNYDEVIKDFDLYYNVQTECSYIFGTAINKYLYSEYKKGNINIQYIEKLHEIANYDLDVALNYLNLEELYDGNIERLIKSMEENYYDEELVMKH